MQELSVIVARGKDNTMLCYPVVETIHRQDDFSSVEVYFLLNTCLKYFEFY